MVQSTAHENRGTATDTVVDRLVPEVGWMWHAGAPVGKAAATRASLKQANIKAKK